MISTQQSLRKIYYIHFDTFYHVFDITIDNYIFVIYPSQRIRDNSSRLSMKTGNTQQHFHIQQQSPNSATAGSVLSPEMTKQLNEYKEFIDSEQEPLLLRHYAYIAYEQGLIVRRELIRSRCEKLMLTKDFEQLEQIKQELSGQLAIWEEKSVKQESILQTAVQMNESSKQHKNFLIQLKEKQLNEEKSSHQNTKRQNKAEIQAKDKLIEQAQNSLATLKKESEREIQKTKKHLCVLINQKFSQKLVQQNLKKQLKTCQQEKQTLLEEYDKCQEILIALKKNIQSLTQSITYKISQAPDGSSNGKVNDIPHQISLLRHLIDQVNLVHETMNEQIFIFAENRRVEFEQLNSSNQWQNQTLLNKMLLKQKIQSILQNQSVENIKGKEAQIQLLKNQHEQEKRKFTQQIRTLNNLKQQEKQSHQRQHAKQCQEIQKLKDVVSDLTAGLQMEKTSAKKQTDRLVKQKEELMQKMTIQINQLQKKNSQLVDQKSFLESQSKAQIQSFSSNLQKQMHQKEQQKEKNHKAQTKQLNLKIDELKFENKEFQEIKKKYEQLCQQYELLKQESSQVMAPVFAESSILNYYKDQKDIQFLKKSVQNFTGNTVCRTKIIYQLDYLSSTNFHSYIDHVPNLMLIIRLANKRVLGGFTVQPFDKKADSKAVGNGFLFSLNTQKCYFQKQPNPKQNKDKGKAITYDDYYAIWGNSEIRLKFKDQLFFSNFGIVNSNFNFGEDKVLDFIGDKNRQVKIQHYQFIKFEFQR